MDDATSPLGDEEAYALAYEVGLRTLDEQSSALREVRDRAGRLLATATLTGGFVAGLFLTANQGPNVNQIMRWGTALATLGFAFVVISTICVWWPVIKIKTTQNSAIVVGTFIEDANMTRPQVYRELALWFGRHASENRLPIERKQWAFTAGLIALLLEMAGLILTIGGTINV